MRLCSVGAIALLGALVLSACAEPEPLELPEALIGYWTTDAPKYADRFLEFRADRMVVFGLGGRRTDLSPIVRIKAVNRSGFLIHHISHLNEYGEVYILSVGYHSERPGYLRLMNQWNIEWKKKSDSASPER